MELRPDENGRGLCNISATPPGLALSRSAFTDLASSVEAFAVHESDCLSAGCGCNATEVCDFPQSEGWLPSRALGVRHVLGPNTFDIFQRRDATAVAPILMPGWRT